MPTKMINGLDLMTQEASKSRYVHREINCLMIVLNNLASFDFHEQVQWLKQAGFGGVMIWSIDMDDFRGTCMGLQYPLINAAKEELKGYKVANLEASSSNALGSIGNKLGQYHILVLSVASLFLSRSVSL